MAATKALRSSPFPFIPSYATEWTRNYNSDVILRAPDGRGSRLPSVVTFGFSQEMLYVSYDLFEQTEMIEGYCQGKLEGDMAKGHVGKYRSIKYDIQHRLISLPELDDQPVYESYRLALWIYSFAVTTAIRFYLDTRRELVGRLVRALTRTEYDSSWVRLPEALLWIYFLGGITATGLPERVWFVENTSALLVRLKLKDWADVKLVLHSFLWLDRGCDAGARVFWSEVSHLLQTSSLDGKRSSEAG